MTENETARLAALRRYRILDTDPEQAFDDLALLASQICGTPMALITLVDSDRQWFKARVGTSIQETSRSISFCAHAIQQRDLMIVPDARGDGRFRDNPLVTGDPHIRFYAGAPLVTHDGHALGTLCVVDRVPRTLTHEQTEALQALRHQAEAQLELRANLFELKRALAARDRAEQSQRKLSALIPHCSICTFNMVIPGDPASIPKVTDGVLEMLTSKAWPETDVMHVELALTEALANAIRHGCKNDPSKQVQCCITVDEGGEVVIVVRDPGTGFDPTAVSDPLHPDNVLKASGRGIFLINELMDDVAYGDEGRELHMRKKPEKAV